MRDLRYATLGMFLLLIGCNIQDIDVNNIKIENLHEFAIPFGTSSYTTIELFSNVVDPASMSTDPSTGQLTFVNFVGEEYLANATIEIDSVSGGVMFTDHIHTLDFDISGSVDIKDIDSLTLRIVTINEIPISSIMDIFILNADEDTLYSVTEKQTLDIPFLKNGIVLEPKTNIEDVPFGVEGIEALSNGEIMRVIFTVNTPPTQTAEDIFVVLQSEAKLEVILAARAEINFEL